MSCHAHHEGWYPQAGPPPPLHCILWASSHSNNNSKWYKCVLHLFQHLLQERCCDCACLPVSTKHSGRWELGTGAIIKITQSFSQRKRKAQLAEETQWGGGNVYLSVNTCSSKVRTHGAWLGMNLQYAWSVEWDEPISRHILVWILQLWIWGVLSAPSCLRQGRMVLVAIEKRKPEIQSTGGAKWGVA